MSTSSYICGYWQPLMFHNFFYPDCPCHNSGKVGGGQRSRRVNWCTLFCRIYKSSLLAVVRDSLHPDVLYAVAGGIPPPLPHYTCTYTQISKMSIYSVKQQLWGIFIIRLKVMIYLAKLWIVEINSSKVEWCGSLKAGLLGNHDM